MNLCNRDEENWGICRSKSLGVYEDRRALDFRKVKIKGEISGGKSDKKFIAVRQIGKFGRFVRLVRSRIFIGQIGRQI
jgi:hypothetical protein